MKKQTIIINVGRQLGSGGKDIAMLLAKRFGCEFFDREILNLAAKESGFSERFFEQNDEQRHFLRSLGHLHAPLLGDTNIYSNRFSQESLFKFQSDAIRHAASQQSCVFVGRCADYILRDFDNAVSIFVTADLDDRVARVQERHQLTSEEAVKYIRNGENRRSTYYNYYTGKKWGDSASYDLCVNSSRLGIEATADIVAQFINAWREQP